MNQLLEQMIKELPESPTKLNWWKKRKIHKILPVPYEYEIFWADIISLKGYPAGVVVTDKALVFKASKDEIKHNKKIFKKRKRKKGEKKEKAPKLIYRIIPWEHFNPEEYEVIIDDSDEGENYIVLSGEMEIARFSEKSLRDFLVSYRQSVAEKRIESEAVISAINTINIRDVMFNATYARVNTKTGHGVIAEEVGAKLDRLYREESIVVGRDNAKNGPDKLVDSLPVQCKYCNSAGNSIGNCFKRDPNTGLMTYRYMDLDGNPMMVEVPKDQYLDAVEIMKDRIAKGQVKGATDPNEAYSIVREGKLTHQQALNLAKAGTIESIKYDAVTGAVNCLSVFGISAVVSFAQIMWVTRDYKKAAKSAIVVGLEVYGFSFAGSLIASQLSRTSLMSVLNPMASEVSKLIGDKMTTEIVNAFRTLAGKESIYGAAAQKSFVNFLGSTLIAQTVMIIVFSIPDTYRVISGKISGAQYFKNITSLVASFIGSLVTSVAVGAFLGKKFGEKMSNFAIRLVSMGAGIVGGAALGLTVKGIGNLIREDDILISMRMFNAVLQNRFIDTMLLDEEQDEVLEMINEDETELKKILAKVRKSKTQEKDIIDYIDKKIQVVIDKRDRIDADNEERMVNSIGSVTLQGELAYEL